jgi:transposase
LDADRGPGSSPIDNQIEADIRGRSADQRQAVRQHKTRPLIAALKTWLEKTLTQLPGASEIAKAVRYALNQGDGLTRFLDDGRIEIDSNSIERAMRPVALTRKNSLCAGSNDGAENWAMLASLIETCKLNSVNPQAYFTDVLTKLVNNWPNRRLAELLPWAWSPEAP